MKSVRPLRADEIDVRVGTVGAKGATMLLYKDARVDMTILDETFGPMNWQKSYSRDNANCVVSVWDDEKKQWVSKEDTGTESFTEKEKGLASDSFKRACFNWGIGRELYTAPFIFFKTGTEKDSSGRYKLSNPSEMFGIKVSEIEYEELNAKRIITKLVLTQKGNEVFVWRYGNK